MTSTGLPITIIGGYLGAGKTTLLNRLLTEAHGLRAAVLVNDFGEVNIDAALVTEHAGDTLSLANGCMCCSMADGFAAAVARILKQGEKFDHVIVEASGVSDPGRIAETGRAFGLVVDGIIVVVDVEQIRSQAENKYVGDTVLRQLAQADMLISTSRTLSLTWSVPMSAPGSDGKRRILLCLKPRRRRCPQRYCWDNLGARNIMSLANRSCKDMVIEHGVSGATGPFPSRQLPAWRSVWESARSGQRASCISRIAHNIANCFNRWAGVGASQILGRSPRMPGSHISSSLSQLAVTRERCLSD